uniref:L27 domain-containing protein n=1 Tax=Angiostrongylus cantonensis TaxID=6313 RepID=A0A0K0CTI4_ANGCA
MPLLSEDKDVQTPKRPRVHGPILAVVPIPSDAGRPFHSTFIVLCSAPSSANDYHSRTKPAFKSYKLMKKLSQRPRLRIRRPGEKAISENTTQDDPNLTPFQNSAKARFGYGSHSIFSVGPVLRRQFLTFSSLFTRAGFGAGPSELPPELANVGFEVSGNGINLNVVGPVILLKFSTLVTAGLKNIRKQPNPEIFKESEGLVIPQNSGLRPVAPPKELLEIGGFGPHSRGIILRYFHSTDIRGYCFKGLETMHSSYEYFSHNILSEDIHSDFFTGDSALTPSRGPTGDGYGPPIFPGGAIPPPVPAVGLGGAAAGKSPYAAVLEATENPPTTVKPSALLNVLNKADRGFNQAITHFEQESPLETAAIDILEVALGSTKLDSQAKLLGHVDRAIGLDNLQRIQRWANTAGAMDVFKEQMVKFIKNFEPVENILPTLPPEFDFLLKPSGR